MDSTLAKSKPGGCLRKLEWQVSRAASTTLGKRASPPRLTADAITNPAFRVRCEGEPLLRPMELSSSFHSGFDHVCWGLARPQDDCDARLTIECYQNESNANPCCLVSTCTRIGTDSDHHIGRISHYRCVCMLPTHEALTFLLVPCRNACTTVQRPTSSSLVTEHASIDGLPHSTGLPD